METELSALPSDDLVAALHHIERQMDRLSPSEVALSQYGQRLYNLHIAITDILTSRQVVDLRGIA
jgi:hypothetical protein